MCVLSVSSVRVKRASWGRRKKGQGSTRFGSMCVCRVCVCVCMCVYVCVGHLGPSLLLAGGRGRCSGLSFLVGSSGGRGVLFLVVALSVS